MKRSLFLLACFLTAGTLLAQDMPPLPDLPNQNQPASASPGLPQAMPAPAAQPAADPNAVPALPALSSSPAPAATPAADANPALPALPDQTGAPAPSSSAALPPLPSSSAPAAASAPANPPLPSDQAQPADAQTQTAEQPQAAPAEEQKAPEAKPVHKHKIAPWKVSKARPNSIFDGVVRAKGGNVTSRIAWTAQEVLNAFEFHGYHVVHEKGNYPGQGKAQYRTLTFKVPKSKLTMNVYLKPMGKKVWVRVRPSEPPLPAAFTKAQVEKMRKADTVAFSLLKKKFGSRISPYYHWSSFEPQGHTQAAADEAEQIED